MKKFKPFSRRTKNLEIRNYYIDNNGKKVPTQSHLTKKFNYFEIVKWEKNKHYGNEHLYKESWSGESYVDEETGVYINKSCFENPETCYVISFFENVYDDDSLHVRSVGLRPFDLSLKECLIYRTLVKDGYKEIRKQIKEWQDKN
jgi:hypothetical protein